MNNSGRMSGREVLVTMVLIVVILLGYSAYEIISMGSPVYLWPIGLVIFSACGISWGILAVKKRREREQREAFERERKERLAGAVDVDVVKALEERDADVEVDDNGEVLSVYLRGDQVTDAVLTHLKRLSKLQTLDLGDTQITDAGLVHLKSLNDLQYLSLQGTQVADAGLVHLKGMASLEDLGLGDTQVTDAGLAHLKEIASLKYLELDGTQVTDAGVADLGEALPSCDICANWLAREADKPDEDRPFCANCRAHTRYSSISERALKCQTCKGSMQTPSKAAAAGLAGCAAGLMALFAWSLLVVFPAAILGSILEIELLPVVAVCGLPIVTIGLSWYVSHHTRKFRRNWMQYVNDYEDRHQP